MLSVWPSIASFQSGCRREDRNDVLEGGIRSWRMWSLLSRSRCRTLRAGRSAQRPLEAVCRSHGSRAEDSLQPERDLDRTAPVGGHRAIDVMREGQGIGLSSSSSRKNSACSSK